MEWRSRIHTDTLRQEWTITTKTLGIPVANRQGPVAEEFPGCYSAITDQEPNQQHWLQRPVDLHETLFDGMYHCGGGPRWFRDRQALLAVVYGCFKDRLISKSDAAEYLRRIDQLDPPITEIGSPKRSAEVDAIFEELGVR